jgi:hypothetical protein
MELTSTIANCESLCAILPFETHLVLHQNQPQQRKACLNIFANNGMNWQLSGIHHLHA